MTQLDLESEPPREAAGFRLHRFEVFNWGTFDRQVWKIEPAGNNALLTGDIGSGKSTLVDALTTLLVPAQRITYNQAAGAERRERTLNSYVRGFFKSERDQDRFAARSVSLRGEGSYSVLLGHFRNEGFSQEVTLAQVFWTQAAKSQPERFYVVAGRDMSVAADFGGFGGEIASLKRRLRSDDRIQIFESFSQYGQEFRRRMEIRSEQALELFYQTVSMKVVGNLTEFVREHMLDRPDLERRLEGIQSNFNNLNRAHEAVLKAKDQVARLQPMVLECDACLAEDAKKSELIECREGLHSFYGGRKLELLGERLARLEAERARCSDHDARNREELSRFEREREEAQRSVRENGGGRLEAIARELEELERARAERAARNDRYLACCRALGLAEAEDIQGFHANRAAAEGQRAALEAEKERLELLKVDLKAKGSVRAEKAGVLERELESLRGRRSSIPRQFLQMRQGLCEALSVDAGELPFAGELIQVRREQSEWEGALERLLHSFGLSLLVPGDLYGRVSRYVNATHLGGRLVYFHVKEDAPPSRDRLADRRLVFHKLQVVPDSPFRGWLEGQIASQFEYVCCDDLEEFQKLPRAMTREGQVKGGRRHEKDDRRFLGDRSNYVLGWDNAEKIAALEAQWNGLVGEEKTDRAALAVMDADLKGLEARREAARDLTRVGEFQEIDWRSPVRDCARLDAERKALVESSDLLRTLQASLVELDQHLAGAKDRERKLTAEMATIGERMEQARGREKEAREAVERLSGEQKALLFPRLEAMEREAFGERKLTVESCDNAQVDHREWLQRQLDALEKRRARLTDSILKRMMEYKAAYPLETSDMDAGWESAGEYREALRILEQDDLPRHERRFKELLNEGSINDIALFQNQLNKELEGIAERIRSLNASLKDIEYGPGSYIELAWEWSPDTEVRDFRQRLKDCLEGTLSGDGAYYGEETFLKVKEIVDRFQGREGTAELDRKWTAKVTDVRNWRDFLVYERWKENGEVKDVYSDSSGKSGGQKEKLAYTILASALAYQFGLNWGEARSKAFRFAMIDEAFGRGSDESARYALELFKKLGLQLLIVTPLQKIHVIEDYVHSVHFIHSEEGRYSKVRNISIEEHLGERARRKKAESLP